MPTKLGDQNISKIYLGETALAKLYLGDNLVFDNVPPPPVGGFSHDLRLIETYEGGNTLDLTWIVDLADLVAGDKIYVMFGAQAFAATMTLNGTPADVLTQYGGNNSGRRMTYGEFTLTAPGSASDALFTDFGGSNVRELAVMIVAVKGDHIISVRDAGLNNALEATQQYTVPNPGGDGQRVTYAGICSNLTTISDSKPRVDELSLFAEEVGVNAGARMFRQLNPPVGTNVATVRQDTLTRCAFILLSISEVV